jgi:Lrp/AsnC family transcriptional regulator for asnA, asnC and gidA
MSWLWKAAQRVLDELDRRLVGLLRRDARRSTVSLAEELGISDVAVHKRLRSLVRRGIIRCTLHIDFKKAGAIVAIMAGLKVDAARIDAAVEALASYARPVRVTRTSGRFNLLIAAYFASPDELAMFLTDFLGGIEGLQSREVLFIVQASSRRRQAGGPVPLDEKDEAMIRLLQEDSRQSAAELSRRAGLSLRTGRRRLARLLACGVVLPILMVKPGVAGLWEGEVGLKVSPRSLERVWRLVTEHPSVADYAVLTIGAFDIVVSIWGESREALERIVETEFKALEGVESCELFASEGQTVGLWGSGQLAGPPPSPMGRKG